MSVPAGTPGAGDGEIAAGADASADVVDTVASLDDTVSTEGQSTDASGEGGSDGGDEAALAEQAADEADLAEYPESVREDFKALSPEKRKALYEQAEKRAEARITENRQRLEKIETERAAETARRAEIRSRTGKHVGAEAQKLELPNGNTIELPSYDEMVKLSTTQRGRDQLAEKYNLDDDSTEFWRFIFDRNREALDASADLLDDAAWGKLDANLRDGIKAELGVDPDTILSGAKNPRDIIRQVAGHFQGQISQLKKEHESRAEALNANAEALRGRALAGSSRNLATGGRSAGGGEHVFTREELGRMDVPTYRQNKAEIERQDRAGLIR